MSESSHSESSGGYGGQGKKGGATKRASAGRTDLGTTRRYVDGGMGAGARSNGSGTTGGDALAARDDMYELSAPSSTSSWTTSDGLDSVADLKYRKQGAGSR